MAGSGTAYLCAGEGKGNEDLSGKECGIRGGGAVRGGEEAEGARVEGGEEGGCREQCGSKYTCRNRELTIRKG